MGSKKPLDDFVLTLSDGGEDFPEEVDEVQRTDNVPSIRKRKSKSSGNGRQKKQKLGDSETESIASDMASDFEFQVEGDIQGLQNFDAWEPEESKSTNGVKKGVDIDEIISKRKSAIVPSEEDSNQWDGIEDDSEDELLAEDGFGMGAPLEDEEQIQAVDDGHSDAESIGSKHETGSNADSVDIAHSHPMDPVPGGDEASSEDEEEKAKQAAFFAPEEKLKHDQMTATFQTMSLSRPVLRGLAAMQFSNPTPIQAKTVPIALLGKDIVGSAVTGSGKTAAFMIPILERLLYRSRKVATSRVAILMPTRELAVQCFTVGKKLASFTDITFCQLVGGFSLREQENVLKQRPDVIIATPGRFIDHMRNSASFTIDTLEILVLDEADRMLEDGFADELNEILTTIPKSRQTMLFSATMTSSIDRLIGIGLNKPVRVMVDAKKQTVTTLTQEFLRLRPGREEKRLAYLLYLCTEIFTDRCIIFFRQKKEAHRVRIIFALFGFKAAELHGNMTQEQVSLSPNVCKPCLSAQRIGSVEKFRAGAASHLLATDVAARGLDIKGVESIINYEAPQSHEIYLHRVGRTARAGRSGRSCTLASEADRKVVKAAVKTGRTQGAKIISRTVEPHLIDAWAKKLDGMENEVEEILREEKEQKEFASVEMQMKRGENLIDHESEIMSRPKRTWFESEKDKKAAKQKDLNQLNGTADNTNVKKFKRKLSGKEKKQIDTKQERKEGSVWRGKTKGERETPGMKAGSRGKPAKAKRK